MNAIAHIGHVPHAKRVPAWEIVSMARLHREYPSAPQLVDVDDDGPTSLPVVPWPNKLTEWADSPENFCLLRAYSYYIHEWMMRRDQNVKRFITCIRHVINFFGPGMDPMKINVAAGKRYEDHRYAQGVCGGTVLKELRLHLAAMHHNRKRERMATVPYIEMPQWQGAFRRPLTEEEFRLVMRQPMSARLRRYYYVAYFTGHRSRAIEELQWSRVDLERRMIDFNVPGRRITNKRRSKDFPITDDFYARLVAWKATAKDDYVIGLGPKGALSLTFREADYVVRELAGLKDPTLVPRHCMRKMFATDCFERQVDAEVVGWLMADDPRTLRKHYVTFKHSTLLAAASARTRPKVAA